MIASILLSLLLDHVAGDQVVLRCTIFGHGSVCVIKQSMFDLGNEIWIYAIMAPYSNRAGRLDDSHVGVRF